MSKQAITITLSVTLGLISLGLLTGLIVFVISTNTYATQLENVYERSLYELSTNINDIEVDISKLAATNSPDSQREILTNIYQSCVLAGNNLSSLPISNQNTTQLNNYINTLSGYIYSLIENANNQQIISQDDFETIVSLHNQSEVMVYEINNYMSSLRYDYNLLKQINFKNYDNDYLSNVSGMLGTSGKVPTLIYDGPFADSVVNKKIKGLETKVYTQQEAQAIVADKFPNISNLSYDGEAMGKFAVYNFSGKLYDVTYFLQVTKTGGAIINVTSEGSGGNHNKTVAECKIIAEDFAKTLDLSNMKSVWAAANKGIVYVNLAPVIDKVIYYPDLIKVKIDQDSGHILGWEAQNYYYNHVTRTLQTPSISVLEAEELLNSNLTVTDRNVCVIPNKYSGESMAYEFVCTWNNYTYYVYISVVDGAELNILRVVRTTSGDAML